MKKQCPMCSQQVKVRDPYEDAEVKRVKRASAWFVRHKDASGKECFGSLMTAIDRDPLPASEDGIERAPV